MAGGARGDAEGLGRPGADGTFSRRSWPVQGGQCMVPPPTSTGSPRPAAHGASQLVTSDDLLLTGHENGSVGFWRLGPGGCSKKVFTLFTGSLFLGDFGPDACGVSLVAIVTFYRYCSVVKKLWIHSILVFSKKNLLKFYFRNLVRPSFSATKLQHFWRS